MGFVCTRLSLEKVSALKPSSSVKRGFAEVDRSPEQSETQAKKSDAQYERCFPVPENDTRGHTGLTGTFSAVGLGSGGAPWKPADLRDRGVPKQSSPENVAKNLLCELEEPGEHGDAVASSSFSSSPDENRELKRSFGLESVHDMSVVTNVSPLKDCPRGALLLSFQELDENETPAFVPPQSESATPKQYDEHRQKNQSNCSESDHLHVRCNSLVKSPPFLKPKSVVAFRSYCSSINRSNNSRLSIASMDAMDMSASTSYHSVPTAVTPVQKNRPSLNSSLYQVGQAMFTYIAHVK